MYDPHANHCAARPRWITTQSTGRCATCGATIPRGASAFLYPQTTALFCAEHGEAAVRALVAVDATYGGCCAGRPCTAAGA